MEYYLVGYPAIKSLSPAAVGLLRCLCLADFPTFESLPFSYFYFSRIVLLLHKYVCYLIYMEQEQHPPLVRMMTIPFLFIS